MKQEREPALQSESNQSFFFFFYPAISWPSQITLRLPDSQTTPETERGKINRKKREKECRAGKTDASSDAEIWQVVVRQRSVQIQTQDLVGARVCACVCVWERVRERGVSVHVVTCSSPDHRGLMRKFNQLSYTDRLEAIYLTVRCYGSVLSPASQGQTGRWSTRLC